MKESFRIFVSFFLISGLALDPALASYGNFSNASISSHGQPRDLFQSQALSALAGFFTQGEEDLNRISSAKILGVAAGVVLAVGIGTAISHENSFHPLTLKVWKALPMLIFGVVGLVVQFRYKSYLDTVWTQRAMLVKGNFFPLTRNLTWTGLSNKAHNLSVTFDFADTTDATVQQIREVILAVENNLGLRNKLTPNQLAFLQKYIENPQHLDDRIKYVLTRNPMAMVARDPEGRVIGFVCSAIGRANDANMLPSSMRMMSKWQGPLQRGRQPTAMVDFWFTGWDFEHGTGNLTFAEAMLDVSVTLAKKLGIRRLFAYSNPRGFPTYPHNISIHRYASRVVGGEILPLLIPLATDGLIRDWKELEAEIRARTKVYVRGHYARDVANDLIRGMREYAKVESLPDELSSVDIRDLLTRAIDSRRGYVIRDPAISTHLRRGARLARIIEHAFPDIGDGPGIGGGYAFIMVYDVSETYRKIRQWLNLGHANRPHLFRATMKAWSKRRAASRHKRQITRLATAA